MVLIRVRVSLPSHVSAHTRIHLAPMLFRRARSISNGSARFLFPGRARFSAAGTPLGN